jgi:hypothetical protein
LIEASGRPYKYFASSAQSKEQWVQGLLEQQPVEDGLVCVLSCVEPCQTFDLHRDRVSKRVELVCRGRKCKFYYFYYQHSQLGLIHVRLQSWAPFDVQVCINGRSYLQRQLDRLGISYRKSDNCFNEIADLPIAQHQMDQLTQLDWPSLLDGLVKPLMPLLDHGQALHDQRGYYWTARQSEYASDVMFRDSMSLGKIYPALCQHAITCFHSKDVLRFLGHSANIGSQTEVTSGLKHRIEGVRVKHCLGTNSIKMYDKQGNVLRIETTINNPGMFRVYRRPEGHHQGPRKWLRMRKGTADLPRRVEVCRAANLRYLEALAVVGLPSPSHEVLDPLSRRIKDKGKSYRPLRPISPEDAALFGAILRGEHLPDGFTNMHVREALFGPQSEPAKRLHASRHVSHRLRLLRQHGLIRKVPSRRLYRITPKGLQTMTLSNSIRHANHGQLTAA